MNLRHGFRGLNNGTKIILGIALILVLMFTFVNQKNVVGSITTKYEEINFNKLNPISASSSLLITSDKPEPIFLTDFSNIEQEKYIGENLKIQGVLSLVVESGWLSWDRLALEDAQGFQIELTGCVSDLWNDDTSEKRSFNIGSVYTSYGFLKCDKLSEEHNCIFQCSELIKS